MILARKPGWLSILLVVVVSIGQRAAEARICCKKKFMQQEVWGQLQARMLKALERRHELSASLAYVTMSGGRQRRRQLAVLAKSLRSLEMQEVAE